VMMYTCPHFGCGFDVVATLRVEDLMGMSTLWTADEA
jgi:hypothetical protein